MGFPFDTADWAAASNAIFMGQGMAGVYSFIAIAICIGALAVGQAAEAKKYANHK
ncbi:MAG: hypothetical protein ACPGVN_06895 [Alphaproteobacteria bacterium]